MPTTQYGCANWRVRGKRGAIVRKISAGMLSQHCSSVSRGAPPPRPGGGAHQRKHVARGLARAAGGEHARADDAHDDDAEEGVHGVHGDVGLHQVAGVDHGGGGAMAGEWGEL